MTKLISYPRCIVCGRGTEDGQPFCCRLCELEQQRRTFGHTCQEIGRNKTLAIHPMTPGGIYATSTEAERRRAFAIARFTPKGLA